MITLTMLGTSALLPIPGRALASVFLECGGHGILFDCGEGTQSAARAAGVSLMRMDLLALTHYHGDHIFGIPGLLQTMHSMNRTKPLILTGPAGLEAQMRPILQLAGSLSFDLSLMPMPEAGRFLSESLEGARLTAFPTEHRVPSQGYCFELERKGRFQPDNADALGIPRKLWGQLQKGETVVCEGQVFSPAQVMGEKRKGLRVVFSGDTTCCKSLTEAAKGSDLLILEGTYGDSADVQLATERGHMTFAMAAETAKAAGARKLWLTHFSQRLEEPDSYLPFAAEIFPETVVCKDGMQMTLSFDPDAEKSGQGCTKE